MDPRVMWTMRFERKASRGSHACRGAVPGHAKEPRKRAMQRGHAGPTEREGTSTLLAESDNGPGENPEPIDARPPGLSRVRVGVCSAEGLGSVRSPPFEGMMIRHHT